MELVPPQVTQFPASHSSFTVSGSESDAVASAASVLMKTKRVCRSTKASWMALRRPDPRQGSDEVGTRITVRLCSTHSNTASATAERRGQTVLIERHSVRLIHSLLVCSTHTHSHTLTSPWGNVSIIQTEAVAKLLLQNRDYLLSVRFTESRLPVGLVAHQKGIVALSIWDNGIQEQESKFQCFFFSLNINKQHQE